MIVYFKFDEQKRRKVIKLLRNLRLGTEYRTGAGTAERAFQADGLEELKKIADRTNNRHMFDVVCHMACVMAQVEEIMTHVNEDAKSNPKTRLKW